MALQDYAMIRCEALPVKGIRSLPKDNGIFLVHGLRWRALQRHLVIVVRTIFLSLARFV
jgi:hypothetical protein